MKSFVLQGSCSALSPFLNFGLSVCQLQSTSERY